MNWLRIHVSNLCNFKCPNCHVFELGENNLPNRVMAQEIFDTAVENFTRSMNYLKLNETIVSIYGGETLANKKVIKAGIEKFGGSHNGVKLNWVINSNGSLLHEEDVVFFKKHNVELHISVDGREEIHNLSRPTHKGKGTYHMVVPALELLQRHGCSAQINSYMMPTNYQHLKDIVDIAEKYGIKKIYLDQFYNTEMITHQVGMEKYRDVYFYAMLKDIAINGPWGRVLTNFQKNKNKRDRLKYLLSLDVNIDGSCYVPLDSARTKKLGLRIENFASFIEKGGWDDVCHHIRIKNDHSCSECPLNTKCYGGAIEQVHYHIGDHADAKVSCDFFRDWIGFLTRPVYFRKFENVHVLSVLDFEKTNELVSAVRSGIETIQKKLWKLDRPILLNVSEYQEEFLAACKQTFLPEWVKATTASNTFFHKGEVPTRALLHELTHIFISQKQLQLSEWFTEGVCEMVQEPSYNRLFLVNSIKDNPLSHILASLSEGSKLIEIDHNKPGKNSLYIQSQAFVQYLVETYFNNDLPSLLLPTQEIEIDKHLENVTGKNLKTLLSEFEDFMINVVADEIKAV